ncbi:MAG: hypothetical protein ATN36_03425 [Epulopiscium sp. Nele67-Bin005]|nr:MAG: hypothetical protein ATN36_03425 [Epulopiscium sp. Nele67-Bin005]
MSSMKEAFSFYIVFTMLGIGVYMTWVQSVYLNTVDHLEREAKFAKVIGIIYIILAICGLCFCFK